MSKINSRNVEADGARLLRVYRAGFKLSQTEFGARIGASASQVCEWERGYTPSLGRAYQIELATDGAVPAVSWIPPAKVRELREQLVENISEQPRPVVARGRGRRNERKAA